MDAGSRGVSGTGDACAGNACTVDARAANAGGFGVSDKLLVAICNIDAYLTHRFQLSPDRQLLHSPLRRDPVSSLKATNSYEYFITRTLSSARHMPAISFAELPVISCVAHDARGVHGFLGLPTTDELQGKRMRRHEEHRKTRIHRCWGNRRYGCSACRVLFRLGERCGSSEATSASAASTSDADEAMTLVVIRRGGKRAEQGEPLRRMS